MSKKNKVMARAVSAFQGCGTFGKIRGESGTTPGQWTMASLGLFLVPHGPIRNDPLEVREGEGG